MFIGGHLQETSKAEVLRICASMDEMMDESKEDGINQGRNGGFQRTGNVR
jgi:AP-1 complex subunit sigma 1/2